MGEMHLRQHGFTDSACVPFPKDKERIQKFKETGYSRDIYQNELDKAGFQHDMAYGDFKDLTRRTGSDEILRDKAFNIAKNPNYDGNQRGPSLMVYKFFDKKLLVVLLKNKSVSNQEISEELQKPTIRKFKKRKLYYVL